MERGALSSDEFPEFAKNYVVFCHITSRIPTDKHQNLLQQKGGRGFPYLVFMDAEGEVLAQPNGRSVSAFEKTGHYLTVKSKVEGGDDSLATELFILEVEMGEISPEDAATKREGMELTEEQSQRLDEAIINGKVMALARTVRSQQQQLEVGRKYMEMLKAGEIPTDEQAQPAFYQHLMAAAEDAGDAEAFEKGYNWMEAWIKKEHADNPRAQQFLRQWKATLDRLKAADEEDGGTDGE